MSVTYSLAAAEFQVLKCWMSSTHTRKQNGGYWSVVPSAWLIYNWHFHQHHNLIYIKDIWGHLLDYKYFSLINVHLQALPLLMLVLKAQAPLTPSNWSALYRGRGSPVMSWILLKANNAQQASGVGDKRFFRFKRTMQHMWTAIIRHHVNDITHQQVMRFNQWSKFANIFFKSIWKIPSASGHSHSPFTSCRTRPLWHNGSSLGPHVLNGYGSMTLATTNTIYSKRDPPLVDMWEQVTKIWSASLHCADA